MDGELDKLFIEKRKTLPQKFDGSQGEAVYMTNLGRDGDWVYYVYVQTDQYDIATPQQTAAMKTDMVGTICAHTDIKPLLIGGYGISYWYYNPDRKTLVGHVQITQADCSKWFAQ
jgi:hypothetical protein